MAEPKWTVSYLKEESKKLADQLGKEWGIEHFWAIADRDLPGAAPTDILGLVARAKNYAVFDMAVVDAYPHPGNSDVDASLKRKEILQANADQLGTEEDFLRFFCKTNLLFLAREIFNKWLTFYTHARVCNFFIQKNPSADLYEQDTVKERLLLFPRRCNKSTINIIDCVQWVINFPDVTILVLTATDDLSEMFIDELKNYFIVREGAELTIFQQLFPDFTISARSDGSKGVFNCPRRSTGSDRKKEATASANSTGSNLPGRGCDVFKGDDAINDKNSKTSEMVNKMITQIDYAESLVIPGGYKDLIGTPYDAKDVYNHVKETVMRPEDLKILREPAWRLKAESTGKDERICGEADYDLLFEKNKFGKPYVTYEFLKKRQKRNPDLFRSQLLLDPYGMKQVTFPLDLLYRRTIVRDQLPTKLVYYILWDFAYTSSAKSDYSVGAVVGLDEENRIYVVEVYRDRYTMTELAYAVAYAYRQYMPQMVLIENSLGAQNLESSIRRYGEEIGITNMPLDFFKPDRFLNAKASRIGSLEPLMTSGSLFFLNEISCLDDLYSEFSNFGSATHDDIPDAISHLQRIAPRNWTMPVGGQVEKERRQRVWKMLQEQDLDQKLFGYGAYAPVIPQAPIDPEPGTGDDIDDPYGIPGFKR